MRTGFKNKPGSQGTLFKVSDKSQYADEIRYPRGYTPERYDAVAKKVNPDRDERQYGAGAENLVDSVYRTWSGPGEKRVVHDSQQPLRDLIGTVARSTVPLKHLNGAQFNIVSGAEDDKMKRDYTAGTYTSERNRIDLRPDAVRDFTPVHEIGHHVSHMEGNEHAARYTASATSRGQEEGFADNYALEHARPKSRRKKSVDVPHYEPNEHLASREREFDDSYRRERYGDTTPARDRSTQEALPGMPRRTFGASR